MLYLPGPEERFVCSHHHIVSTMSLSHCTDCPSMVDCTSEDTINELIISHNKDTVE